MRLPRDLSGVQLAKLLGFLGYSITRQSGSHMRLTTTHCGTHHVTVPNHHALRIGTLSSILTDVATHFGMSRDALVNGCSELGNEQCQMARPRNRFHPTGPSQDVNVDVSLPHAVVGSTSPDRNAATAHSLASRSGCQDSFCRGDRIQPEKGSSAVDGKRFNPGWGC
jgi:predicted RNA binding protein YcfA (HicA-like mRNA interferase family)